jgi:hypothetical protein
MGDFPSSRIGGIADREHESDPQDGQSEKRRPRLAETPKPPAPENEESLVIEEEEQHDLDEMA